MSTFKCCGFNATVTPHYDPDSVATGYESRVSIPFDYDSVTLCAYGDTAAECRARLRAKVTALRDALRIVTEPSPRVPPLTPGHRVRGG